MLGGITKWCKTFWIKTFVYMGIGNVCHYYDVLCFLDENFHFIRKNADVSKMFGTNYQIEIIFQKFFRGRCTMLPLSPLGLLEKAFFPIWTIYTFVFSGSGLVTPIFYEDLYILYPSPLFQTLSTPALPFLATLAECEITPDLICYFAWWYYGPKLVKPWYLSTSSTLQCVLCRNTFC